MITSTKLAASMLDNITISKGIEGIIDDTPLVDALNISNIHNEVNLSPYYMATYNLHSVNSAKLYIV